jgi:hypothetical protein
MSHRFVIAALGIVCATLSVTSTGCVGLHAGPDLGILGIPIPVSPYFQKKKEDEFWNHERYERVPILPPLVPGAPAEARDEPSDDEVMRAWERANPIQGGLPFVHEYQRNNVRIVKDKIADYVDPPRVVPLIGPVQLHHCHYKCTIFYSETTRVGWPIPHTLVDEDCQEVIYIDHNHFHMVGNIDPGPSSNY